MKTPEITTDLIVSIMLQENNLTFSKIDYILGVMTKIKSYKDENP